MNCNVQDAFSTQASVVHAATSGTNPCHLDEMYEQVIWPYWAKDPPKNRMVNTPYKPVQDPSTFVGKTSFIFKVESQCAPHLSLTWHYAVFECIFS